ncbi:MAG TPA: hypothetical protein DDW94_08750 [Deltaproteobacteria bacterium]|nr:MAG: hypothetical protein A2Z79_03260 [Deltaproteobacteria bacterium GWA2_55_82]OGQ62301.1 MAG: hypothetical protein A3I81_05170 [Deltaproteobacteria bacterium RIFCSPLOWO2_02_FULL_55_12]OIJ74413.1 MAG: hypothetical protein A2V21_309160 [Deltaproteobacteria bacterium GWC2_55_46]HBG47063.1 hypothetical protein [Deltaproteobacteria bacterium]HCY10878.1 hypothetical protein [Deltaproteobacteria bacterium]
MKKTRIFAAVFAGNMLFFFFYAGVAWALTFFNITPYGRFVAEFFKGRTKEAAKEHMEANRELFESMLKEASTFANLVLTPLAGFVMGVLIGVILSKNRRSAIVWSLLAAAPVSIIFLVKSGGGLSSFIYLAFFLVVTALGGLFGSSIVKKGPEEASDVNA